MENRYAVILAAGEGTRMKSNLYKVLHPILEKPMVQHVIDQLDAIELDKKVTVVGHGADKVRNLIGEKSEFVLQEAQLGTGHAVLQAEDILKEMNGKTLVVCGDTPLITANTYQKLFEHHEKTNARATILTTHAPDPTGYGRVIRNEENQVERIVEHKDTIESERMVKEINTGTYCFDNQVLFKALREVTNENAQGEYYLPDVIEILRAQGDIISAYETYDFSETIGINDRVALAKAQKIMQQRVNASHMRNGVTMLDPDATYIGIDAVIEKDVILHPGVRIAGDSVIKEGAEIGMHSEVTNSLINEAASVRQSVIEDSKVGKHVTIGPYAHIRPNTDIHDQAKVGNFVEVKNAAIGQDSKVPHLSYIGDAAVGKNANLGCGTITVNYDGVKKHQTVIEDDAFIGCNANLIAPISIGKGAFIAAGSTITKNVPADALSIARGKQTNKEGYAARLKNRK